MNKKKIIIDTVSLLSPLTGIGKYTYEISKELRELSSDIEWYYNYGYHSKNLYLNQKDGLFAKKLKKILISNPFTKHISREIFTQLAKVFSTKYDLYWQPNFIPNPNIKSKFLISTVHDFSFYLHPNWHPTERVNYFNKHIWSETIKSDFIITGSSFSKKEIMKYLNFKEEKIKVIYHGIDHNVYKVYEISKLENLKHKLNLPSSFILFVGSIEPRKNLLNLLTAYNMLSDEIKKEIPLVLCGFKGWGNKEIMELINKEKENIKYLGYLSEEELAGVYNLATIFIYPSLYEGFGIPPLEAFACGTAVIASNVNSILEACGDAAIYINPNDSIDIKNKIIILLENKNLRLSLIQKGLNRAKEFSWKKSANFHLELFKNYI